MLPSRRWPKSGSLAARLGDALLWSQRRKIERYFVVARDCNVAWGRKGRSPDLASSESAPRKRVVGVPLAPGFAMVLMVPPASGNQR